jgi:hypothetical protein
MDPESTVLLSARHVFWKDCDSDVDPSFPFKMTFLPFMMNAKPFDPNATSEIVVSGERSIPNYNWSHL